MKKILVVNGSPRRKGNSSAMAAYIAEKLAGKAEVTPFNICEKDVRGCLGCGACKRQSVPTCVQKDDFQALIGDIDTCDAMVILGPVYYGQFPAQLKAFLDRTYCFMDFKAKDLSMASRKDKKIAGYMFAGMGPADVYTRMLDDNLKGFGGAGFREFKAQVVSGVNAPGSVMEKAEALKAADEIVEWVLG